MNIFINNSYSHDAMKNNSRLVEIIDEDNRPPKGGDKMEIESKELEIVNKKSSFELDYHDGWGCLSPQVENEENDFTLHDVEDYRITPQRPLHSHYNGFNNLRMVMYVQRVDFIVSLFDIHGIQKADIIIGDSIVTKNRSSTDPETFLRLSELIEENRLTISFPKKVIVLSMRNGYLQRKKMNSKIYSELLILQLRDR